MSPAGTRASAAPQLPFDPAPGVADARAAAGRIRQLLAGWTAACDEVTGSAVAAYRGRDWEALGFGSWEDYLREIGLAGQADALGIDLAARVAEEVA